MKYAQINKGKVFYIYNARPVLHPRIEVVECEDNVEAGWLYFGGVFSAPSAPVASMPMTDYADFIELIGEDSYNALTSSTNKKAQWITEVWSGRGLVNPNNPKELAALDLMLSVNLITQAAYDLVTGA